MFGRIILITVTFTLLAGCASRRTKYQPHGNDGGYSEEAIDDNTYVARFSANPYTDKKDASVLSQFRAVEICFDKGYRFARIYEVKDLTASQSVQRTSSYSYQQPTYFSGSGTTNGAYTNFSGQASGGNSNQQTQSWQETYHYPVFDTIFSCASSANLLGVKTRNISPDDMKPFVKDLMGAVQLEDVTQDSVNKDILRAGDFVIKVNENRVKNGQQLVRFIDSSKNKEKIILTIIRDGQTKSVRVKTIDGTAMFAKDVDQLISLACTLPETKTRPICSNRLPASDKQR